MKRLLTAIISTVATIAIANPSQAATYMGSADNSPMFLNAVEDEPESADELQFVFSVFDHFGEHKFLAKVSKNSCKDDVMALYDAETKTYGLQAPKSAAAMKTLNIVCGVLNKQLQVEYDGNGNQRYTQITK